MMKAELIAENRPAWKRSHNSRPHSDKGEAETYENQRVENLIVLLHVFGVVLRRLLFVHGVEIELGVVVLDGLEVHPQGFLDAIWGQSIGPCNRFYIHKHTI